MGVKLHRGFESRPLRHLLDVRTPAPVFGVVVVLGLGLALGGRPGPPGGCLGRVLGLPEVLDEQRDLLVDGVALGLDGVGVADDERHEEGLVVGAVTADAVGVQDFLHLIERGVVYQGLVASLALEAVQGDDAGHLAPDLWLAQLEVGVASLADCLTEQLGYLGHLEPLDLLHGLGDRIGRCLADAEALPSFLQHLTDMLDVFLAGKELQAGRSVKTEALAVELEKGIGLGLGLAAEFQGALPCAFTLAVLIGLEVNLHIFTARAAVRYGGRLGGGQTPVFGLIIGHPLADGLVPLLPALTSQRLDKLEIKYAVLVVAARGICPSLCIQRWAFAKEVMHHLLARPAQLDRESVVTILVYRPILQVGNHLAAWVLIFLLYQAIRNMKR